MKINYQSSFRKIWLAIGAFSLVLLFFLPTDADSNIALKNAILVANGVMLTLSLPCSFFAVPVLVASAYYLDMHPTESRGMTLGTILFFVIGLMQWFWIARFWSPAEPPLQKLDLAGGNLD